MQKIPASVRSEVAAEVIRQAVALNWDEMSASERSQAYEHWVDDAKVGGLLSSFIPRSRIRVWLKDGPMKEYARASHGLGPYAQYFPASERIETLVCERALGTEWDVDASSIDVKPNRFRASCQSEAETTLVFWGNSTQAKHLVWAALNAPAAENAMVVVTGTLRHPILDPVRRRLEAVGRRASIRVEFVST